MRIAMLTAGGIAPCLSTSISYLIDFYNESGQDIDIIGYKYGYVGLLTGEYISLNGLTKEDTEVLRQYGGTPLGNCRVKLTNHDDLVKRGLIQDSEDALQKAAEQLKKDKVDVLHTIGGDDTNTTAADLAKYLEDNGYSLRVVGMPKTIDNDIIPIKQSLGASTAADQTVLFAKNVIAEHSANKNTLVVHEVMGRHCGWLTAEAARRYEDFVDSAKFVPSAGLAKEQWQIHGLYIPEIEFDIEQEGKRLKEIMDRVGNVNIFISEGAIKEEILVKAMEEAGEEVKYDAFGHIRLDEVKPGEWFAKRISKLIGAEKTLVQKSGYFSRSAKSNQEDLDLIKNAAKVAVDAVLNYEISGLVGEDDNTDGRKGDYSGPIENNIGVIAFDRIKGGKAFNPNVDWFKSLQEKVNNR